MKRIGIVLVLIGGGIAFFSRKHTLDQIKKNISLKVIGGVTIRSLLLDSNKLEIHFTCEVENKNLLGVTVEAITGKTKWQGNEFGEFYLTTPITIEPKSKTSFDITYHLDISSRGLPAIIRQTWRTGNFTGFVLIDAEIMTNLGSFEYTDVININ